jgi:hypothetical protein
MPYLITNETKVDRATFVPSLPRHSEHKKSAVKSPLEVLPCHTAPPLTLVTSLLRCDVAHSPPGDFQKSILIAKKLNSAHICHSHESGNPVWILRKRVVCLNSRFRGCRFHPRSQAPASSSFPSSSLILVPKLQPHPRSQAPASSTFPSSSLGTQLNTKLLLCPLLQGSPFEK